MNDGEFVRINIPPLTEERRRQMAKMVKATGEECKVSLRSARKDGMDGVKSAVKDGYSEDSGKRREEEIQNMTNAFSKKVDDVCANKEKEIMTV